MNTEQERMRYIASQSIQKLSENTFEKWGNPIQNRELLIPYGYKPIDKALYGIDPFEGEFIVIQGPEKGRKSTILHNIICNIMQYQRLKEKPVIVFDILESSSGPAKVKDTLLCMLASQYLIEQGHRSDVGVCPACNGQRCRELTLSSRSVRFITKTQTQKRALARALDAINKWTLYLFGPGIDEGNTRNLEGSVRRWEWMHQNLGATFFIQDHIQQYYFGKVMSDYEKQQAVVPVISTFVGNHHVVDIALSQLSLGTRKDKEGRQYATGGAQMAAEANTVLQSGYDEDSPTVVQLSIVESRYSGKLTVYGRIDPTSGLIFSEMEYDVPHLPEVTVSAGAEEDMPF